MPGAKRLLPDDMKSSGEQLLFLPIGFAYVKNAQKTVNKEEKSARIA